MMFLVAQKAGDELDEEMEDEDDLEDELEDEVEDEVEGEDDLEDDEEEDEDGDDDGRPEDVPRGPKGDRSTGRPDDVPRGPKEGDINDELDEEVEDEDNLEDGDATEDGDRAASLADITVEVDDSGQKIQITSSKDLSNIVYAVDEAFTKLDDLEGMEYTLDVEGVTDLWVKSGNNRSLDGPGFGEHFSISDLVG